MSLNNYSTFGNGSKEIGFRQISVRVKIEELEVFKEVSVQAYIREGFELYLVEELGFETGYKMAYDAIASCIQIIRL